MSIRKICPNSQFFIFSPRPPTDKKYNYKFLNGDDGSVSVKIVPDTDKEAFSLNEIVPVEHFLLGMTSDILPDFHQFQLFEYAKGFCQKHHADTVTSSLNQSSLNEALQNIEKEIESFETNAMNDSNKHIVTYVP